MLRKIRLTFAMICFVLITLLFLDFTGTLHGWFGWLAKIQFLPAVLALNVGVILFLVILTLVCGRIYCSVICPLGVFQDILAWLGRQPKKRRKLPYSYSPALSWLRYGVLGVFIPLRGGSPFRRGERLYPQDYGKPGAPAGLQRVLRVRPRRLPPDDGEKEGAREGL